MTITRRKLTLQLTPLLDLMLIVFFLQYLQMKENEISRVAASTQLQQTAEQLQVDLEQTRLQTQTAEQEVATLNQALLTARTQYNQLSELATSERDRTSKLLAREELLGQLVVDLFGVPQADIDRFLNDPEAGGTARTPAELAALRQQFKDMAEAKSGRMIRHLLLYDEIRKRCDVWEMHVDAQSVVTINTGSRKESLRLHLTDDGDPDIARFENDFFTVYRSLPDTRSLVVILLNYDRQTRLIVTEALLKSLPGLTRRLTDDSRGQSRFEYADMGIRVDQP